jgi:signal transduction histidine kinase
VLDISHDLKNPLSSAAGYAELLMNKPGLSPDERAGYLRIIHNNSMRAGQLLNGLFELSKLESPDFRLNLDKTDIGEFLRRLAAELLPLFDKAGFECAFDIPDGPLYVALDLSQMSRVLHNLADNAIRYNPEGTEVTISLSFEADTAVLQFKDNGIGIPAEKAGDIFKPFVRADEARNSQTGGSGLGLSIAQKIITAHGGALTLEAGENEGCTFIISLPTI